MVLFLLTSPVRKLTRLGLLDAWPRGQKPPHPMMLWRVLDGAVQRGQIEQQGTGRKGDPLRYFVPNLGATWSLCLDDLPDAIADYSADQG
jgi:hypothetical protein